VFENRVLRRILEPKRGEVTGEWRKLHSEKLHILYSSPNVIRQLKLRRMRCAEHVACRMRNEKCVQGFDGIRMDLREIGWGSVDGIQLAQDRDWWWARHGVS
jgi:hypothetical protein